MYQKSPKNNSDTPLGKSLAFSYHVKHMHNNKSRVKRRVLQILVSVVIAVVIVGVFALVMYGRDIPVLNPQGIIAEQQYQLILITTLLGVFVVVPVFILLFTVAWKYREGNTKAKYEPEFDGSRWLEALWWGIPCLIILLLAVITFISTHALDPYKAIESDKEPVKIQVVSLQWKWLFIYPDEGIATVNHFTIPEDTPVEFTLTSDAPMNSFWLPSLGGQVYTMSGMSTKLHLMANTVGSYKGASANLSGDGFAGMTFVAHSKTQADYQSWVTSSKTSPDWLTAPTYKKLREPTKDIPEKTFGLVEDGIYDAIIMKYMGPQDNKGLENNGHTTSGMDM